jgi:hypothetical protein
LSAHLSAAQIKARLDHPIIDADGHWIEYGPVFTEELTEVIPEGYEMVEDALASAAVSATSRSPTLCGCSAARTRGFSPVPASQRRLKRCCARPLRR